ncbi:MAG: hypothetical protein HY077_13910 [Elusimicrobia bacterium]|nr:hypothetical protein [Elusimicrobiota bacterium]
MSETCGWKSDYPTFNSTEPRVVRAALEKFIRGASREQVNAWDEELPILQDGTRSMAADSPEAKLYTAILEYKLPLESRRPDVVLLENGAVAVLEFKSKEKALLADLDQVGAYARDLRCYHRECADRPVHAVLVPTGYRDGRKVIDGIHVTGPGELSGLLEEISAKGSNALGPEQFLREDAYSPLPTLARGRHHRSGGRCHL